MCDFSLNCDRVAIYERPVCCWRHEKVLGILLVVEKWLLTLDCVYYRVPTVRILQEEIGTTCLTNDISDRVRDIRDRIWGQTGHLAWFDEKHYL